MKHALLILALLCSCSAPTEPIESPYLEWVHPPREGDHTSKPGREVVRGYDNIVSGGEAKVRHEDTNRSEQIGTGGGENEPE